MAIPLPSKSVPDPLDQLNFEKIEQSGASEQELKELEEKGLPASGAAGGVLKGTYPNPEFAVDMATQAELDKEKEDREKEDKKEKEAREAADALKADKSEVATDAELANEKSEREAADKSEKETRESKDNERVVGPAAATDLDVAVYDGATGKKIKDGGKTVAQLLERANHTGTQTAATISDLAAVVKAYRLDEFAKPTANLNINEKKLTKVADPTEALDAANKEYVDSAAAAAAAGLSVKSAVSYASTANITVESETEKTLEGKCPLTIDGESGFAAGTRILLKDQTTKKQNGIYEVTFDESFGGSGSYGGEGKFGEGEKWKLTRASDADTTAEVKQGMFVSVVNGAANTGSAWVLQTADPIEIGITNQEFARFTASPTGTAGGDLEGTYPNPQIKSGTIVLGDLATALQELLVPVGSIVATGRSTAANGYLLCDGSQVSRTGATLALFEAIGTKFGVGNGSTTFNLPDLRGRVPVGVDDTAARLSEKDALGESSGTETHTLTTEQIPSHAHQQIARFGGSGAVNGLTLNTLNNAIFGSENTGNTGGGKSHPNMQPYQIVNYMIKT